MEVGTVVMKVSGRESGRLGVVLKKIDNNFVTVTGPRLLTGVKRRKCNVIHLEPTKHRLDIKEDAADEEVMEAFKKSGLVNTLNLKFPSAAGMKSEKAKETSSKMEKPKTERKAGKADKGKKSSKTK